MPLVITRPPLIQRIRTYQKLEQHRSICAVHTAAVCGVQQRPLGVCMELQTELFPDGSLPWLTGLWAAALAGANVVWVIGTAPLKRTNRASI